MSLRERWREWRESRAEYDAAADEMQFHIEQETERNIRQGMTPDVARREATRAFGGVDRYAERARDERTGSVSTDLGMDVRYALRTLRKTPGFTAVAVLTLALGVGANTAVFSVVNAALLRAMPFPEPDQLVQVRLTTADASDNVWSYPKYEALRDQQRSFTYVAGYARWEGNLSGVGEPERLIGERITAQYFDVLGVHPVAGRAFTEEEARNPGDGGVVLLSDALWRRRFNADASVVGRTVQLDGVPISVVGVLPADFRGLSGVADVFVPMSTVGRMLSGRFAHFMTVVARLDPSVTFETAQTEVEALGKRIDEQYRSPRDNTTWGADIKLLEELRVDPAIRRSVLVLFGAVTGVLLIACANLASLLLARGVVRRREVAVRLALGARPLRVVRQLMTEAMVLALLGGGVGVLVAWAGVRGLTDVAANAASVLGRDMIGFNAVALAGAGLDTTVLLFAFAISIGTGLLFGLAPARQVSRAELTSDLRQGGEATRARLAVRGLTTRNLLVVSEIALAFMLLVGSGLMLRSLSRLLDLDAGVDPRNLLTVRVSLPEPVSTDAATTFWPQLVERVAALPAVRNVAFADCPPLIGRCNVRPFWADETRTSEPQPVGVHYVTSGYFSALGVPIMGGRAFAPQDRTGSPPVVIINESAAQKFFPGQNAIGRRVAVAGGFAEGAEIIGIVADQRFQALEIPAVPDVYISSLQVVQGSGYLFVRTAADPLALAGAVRREVQRLNPNLPIYDVQTMEQRVGTATARTRVTGLWLTLFAVIAALLALIGIYGVVAYAVTQRTREFGVRVALGAASTDVAALVLRHSAAVVGLGVVVGLIGAWSATRVLRSLLYDVAPNEPAVFISLTVATLVVAFAATALPVRRATRVDPVIALKAE